MSEQRYIDSPGCLKRHLASLAARPTARTDRFVKSCLSDYGHLIPQEGADCVVPASQIEVVRHRTSALRKALSRVLSFTVRRSRERLTVLASLRTGGFYVRVDAE